MTTEADSTQQTADSPEIQRLPEVGEVLAVVEQGDLVATATVVDSYAASEVSAVLESGAESQEPAAASEVASELPAGEPLDTTPPIPTLRYLGETGPELDYVSPEEEISSFGDVMIQLVDAALEATERQEAGLDAEFDGETVAQIFCRGDVGDPRVNYLLLLLAQNQPVTAELALAVASETGHEDLVLQARIAREELARVGDVSVEQVGASGTSFAVPEAGPYVAGQLAEGPPSTGSEVSP